MSGVINKLKRITKEMGPRKAIQYVVRRTIQESGLETANETNAVSSDFSCPMPSLYCIEPGNICNLKCPFCPTGFETNTTPKGIMSLDNFKIILNKIAPYAKWIGFYNWGEPFLNPNIIEMVSLASEKGIETSIHSNLTMRTFDEKECTRIIQSGLSLLHGSIDGASQETYGMYKRGGSFDKAIGNLVQLKNVKEKIGSKTPNLRWGFLINKFNEHEVEKAKHIKFGLMFSYANWISSYHKDFNKLVQLNEEKTNKKIFTILEQINSVINKLYSSKFPKSINNIIIHKDLRSFCKQPFNFMTINWDGNVFPCCAVYDNKMIIGNLLTTDISHLWNNNEYKKCRDYIFHYNHKINTGSVCEICPSRMYYQKNSILAVGKY
jgi:radical SAM protein with 4Fe4S-binding SPASM domain